jgi:hypothetical protein
MGSKWIVSFILVIAAISGCKSFSSAPIAGTAKSSRPTVEASSELAAGEIRVRIVDSKEFNGLTPGSVLDPAIRDGVTVFSEDLFNDGKNGAHLIFQVKSAAIEVETRIREDVISPGLSSFGHLTRTRFSTADFRLDQVKLTRSSGVITLFSAQGTFDLEAGERVQLEWVAHSSSTAVLCPFWEHQVYLVNAISGLQKGALNWTVIGSSLKSNVARVLEATGDQRSDQELTLKLIDDQDSATLNQVAGDGVPNVNDGQFGCDGLMELLPSSQ